MISVKHQVPTVESYIEIERSAFLLHLIHRVVPRTNDQKCTNIPFARNTLYKGNWVASNCDTVAMNFAVTIAITTRRAVAVSPYLERNSSRLTCFYPRCVIKIGVKEVWHKWGRSGRDQWQPAGVGATKIQRRAPLSLLPVSARMRLAARKRSTAGTRSGALVVLSLGVRSITSASSVWFYRWNTQIY